MNRKTCMITGANAGIGKAAAVQIAEQGHHVIIACRDQARGEAALSEIRQRIASEDVELMMVDMSLQSSIRDLAHEFCTRYEKLDVLIHNAAHFDISQKTPQFTAEGVESVWATNHLGPVLLTELLLAALKAGAPSRVITVSSQGLVMHPFLKVYLSDPQFRVRKFSVARAYYQSKLAQVMYTYWLAERYAEHGITANCIRVTNVKIDLARYPDISKLQQFLYGLKSRFSISPVAMAKTYTYLALSPEVDGVSGGYFDEKRRRVNPSGYATRPENIAAVMAMTMRTIKGGSQQ